MKIVRLRLAFALLLVATSLFAQQRAQGPRSPEVLPDNRVTFRLSAPAATTVALNGGTLAMDSQRTQRRFGVSGGA